MNDSNSDNTIKTLFLGVALGTIIGLLFAPERGEEVRKTIKNKLDRAMEDINTQGMEIRDNVTRGVEDIKNNVEGKVNDAKDKVNQTKNKAAREVRKAADDVEEEDL